MSFNSECGRLFFCFEPLNGGFCLARLPCRRRATGQSFKRLTGLGGADLFQHPQRTRLPTFFGRPHGPHAVEQGFNRASRLGGRLVVERPA